MTVPGIASLSGFAWATARIIAAVYAGCLLLVFLRQSRYIFYPGRHVETTPASVGLEFETVRFPAPDGQTLSGWFVPAPAGSDAPVILCCHGNAGDIGDRIEQLQILHTLGFSSFMFDYRGYGTSSGTPSERGTYLDARAAWDELVTRRNIPTHRIAIFGQSLGGPIATHLAKEVSPAALIIEGAFTSAPEMAGHVFPWLKPFQWACRFRYNTLQMIREVRCPVLIAHSPDDRTVPFAMGLRIFDAANIPKEFMKLQGDHNDCGLEFNAVYRGRFQEFIRHATARL